ncbi:MAG: TIGR00159 family protein [Ruminococcaceae bacterium]|nr:TIGR00159 family protein [Oscillospiraceae bacterium]
MNAIKEFFEYILNQFTTVGLNDIIDILVVSVLFYYIIIFIQDRRAGKLAVGIFLLFAILGISSLFRFNVLTYILKNIVQVGLLAIFIIFQPEIRSMLEKMGNESVKNLNLREAGDESETKKSIEALCTATQELAATKTGALIVIERGTKLGDNIKTGVIVNADINVFLLKNIFYNKAPLHDGAVIIRDNRIYACGCFLPLSYNANIIRNVGTRHRAAIGMSENSDAIVIVVSEETGIISLAISGNLERNFDFYSLKKRLTKELIQEEKPHRKVKLKLPINTNKTK